LEESGGHAPENDCGGFSIAEDGFAGGGFVPNVRARAQPNEGRELVAHRERVGPKSSDPSIAVGKGVDSHPFRMCPGAGFDDGGKLIRGQGCAEGDVGVQVLRDLTQCGFELNRLRSDLGGGDPGIRTDHNLDCRLRRMAGSPVRGIIAFGLLALID